ncbi:hypothetical protein PP178_05990 [Zeaxanthinibacter sp. PT1]|uniref:hypothetical protein n=1 Tax=Zeaxanthinibacter TaxID=561554 RepID=UPI002349FE0B|nr:hypothetical protein [Zeaxanthinibacter sp. PT1]MDC6351097.1 hypothetical protein [Zeaxanthinibacter sp. PT1]
MMKEKLIVIKEADLTNNCPECFAQDLRLTFYQKESYGKLFHRTTKNLSHEIQCKKCGSVIYPVQWTQDIDRTFEYYRKLVTPNRSSIRFTFLFYALVLLLIVLVGAGTYMFIQGGFPA